MGSCATRDAPPWGAVPPVTPPRVVVCPWIRSSHDTAHSSFFYTQRDWMHIALTWTADPAGSPHGQFALYLNGRRFSNYTICAHLACDAGRAIQPDGVIHIGQDADRPWGDFDEMQSFTGVLDELQVSDHRTPIETTKPAMHWIAGSFDACVCALYCATATAVSIGPLGRADSRGIAGHPGRQCVQLGVGVALRRSGLARAWRGVGLERARTQRPGWCDG
eukprot:5667655-Prymnesium_polylepis.1